MSKGWAALCGVSGGIIARILFFLSVEVIKPEIFPTKVHIFVMLLGASIGILICKVDAHSRKIYSLEQGVDRLKSKLQDSNIALVSAQLFYFKYSSGPELQEKVDKKLVGFAMKHALVVALLDGLEKNGILSLNGSPYWNWFKDKPFDEVREKIRRDIDQNAFDFRTEFDLVKSWAPVGWVKLRKGGIEAYKTKEEPAPTA